MLQSGFFLERLNRFIATVRLETGETVQAHLANTGRMRELLIPGAPCVLTPAQNPKRKTAWDLRWIMQRNRWVCLRAVYANDMVHHWLLTKQLRGFEAISNLRKEVRIGGSRFDFCFNLVDIPWVVEVKSVNLVFEDGRALFPDAPTSRGSRHLEELTALQAQGFQTGLFLVVMGQTARSVRFNTNHDPLFAALAHTGREAGMAVHAYRSVFHPPVFNLEEEIPIEWEQ